MICSRCLSYKGINASPICEDCRKRLIHEHENNIRVAKGDRQGR